ncbi:MAG: N-hydroxyarylamine O-acetyltransferase [Gammaproteobacteria bacterium]|jgi:N-hydroxyarylamine O-acetyltransferase
MINIERCLDRINYQGSREPSLETLKALQLAFVYAIPFENLDIHLQRKIELSAENSYRKIIDERRGGFCYECNTLFHSMLEMLGFDVKFVAATMQLPIAMNIEFEHMALMVRLDDVYLVDVGNGQSCQQAMRIGADEIVKFENVEYRLDEFEDGHALYFRGEGDDWLPRFSFTTVPRQLKEYEEMCHIIQTSPASHFTHRKVITIARPDGRVSLVDRDLEIKQAGRVTTRSLKSNEQYKESLETYFSIQLPELPKSW